MAKFINIVKVKVKPEHREEYLKLCDEEPKFDGMISAKYVRSLLIPLPLLENGKLKKI